MKIARSSATKAKKGAKWKKGAACSSNPTKMKFRNAARTGTFGNIIKESGLTAAALLHHDARNQYKPLGTLSNFEPGKRNEDGDDKEDMDFNDTKSAASSWATDFSACSNASFDKLMISWDPTSALHKEMLAVLAAVTEVIKENGGQETEAEYLGAFLTSLTTLESDMSITATVGLVNMVVKRIPQSVIRKRFADISDILYGLLEKFAESDHNALLCSLLNISSYLCRQQDAGQFAHPKSEAFKLFNAIMTFISHSKPKVRRTAQKNICGIIRSSPDHPSALICGAYVTEKLEENRKCNNNVSLLHILTFLSHGMALLPGKFIKSVAEGILKAMSLGDPLVAVQGMSTLSNMFMYESTQLVIKAELNAKLINAMYDFQPNLKDPQPLIAWAMVMRSAFVHLNKADDLLFAMNIGKFFSVSMNLFLCENETVHTVNAKILAELLLLCSSDHIKTVIPGGTSTPVEKILTAMESSLEYQYHSAWKNIFMVWQAAFTSLANAAPERLANSVPIMADLREREDFEWLNEIDHSIGAAIKSLGPKLVLEKIPLNITGVADNETFPRSWLMPVLRENIKETELRFFIEYFFPLSGNLSKAENAAKQKGNKNLEICYRALANQVWSLLPAFCNRTTDLAETFPKVAQTLGILLTAQPGRRVPILSALRKLIATSSTPEVVGKYAKNYLPIMANIYMKKNEPERTAVYETIKSFVDVTDGEVSALMFKTAMGKVTSAEGPDADFTRMAAIDIARAFLPKLSGVEGAQLYELCVSSLENGDKSLQKKAYLSLEDIFRAACCREFVEQKLPEIQKFLVTSADKVTNASAAPRLRCIRNALSGLTAPSEKFVVAVIPEAVLCCRESAAKIKQAALEVVIECAIALQRWNIPDAFSKYVTLLMGGLAGSPTSVSAAIIAISHCLRHFKEQITENEQLLQQLIEAVCTLVVSPTREIVKSALDFIKGLFTLVEMDELVKFTDLILSRIFNMPEDCSKHFRLRIKGIIIRFVRRFGHEVISEMVPESYQKVFSNIRKIENRRKRGSSIGSGSGGDDSDEDAKSIRKKRQTFDDVLGSDSDSADSEDEKRNEAMEARKKKRGVWLKENEDEIIDLMDPSVIKNISSMDPEKYKLKAAKRLSEKQSAEKAGFKMTDDGKLLITLDEEDKRGKKRSRDEEEDSDLEDIDDLLGAMSGYAKSSKTRVSGKSVKTTYSSKSKKSNVSGGTEYRSKKAKGDMKSKSQKYDPYTYIPMSRQTLNKRKRAKLSGQFNNVVRSATKGARKGMKQRGQKRARQT